MVDYEKLTGLLDCETAETWSESLFAIADSLGFEYALYGVVKSRRMGLETAFIRSNYKPALCGMYDAKKLYQIDPTISHCLNSSTPIIWEPGIFRSAEQQALYEMACSYGVRSGITFPVHGPNGECGSMTFATSALPGEKFYQTLAQLLPCLALIRDYALESSQRLIGATRDVEPTPLLTKRELEVLNWAWHGKSSWEISKITLCSEATVNFHLLNVRKKFNVHTRQQALVKAVKYGLIKVD